MAIDYQSVPLDNIPPPKIGEGGYQGFNPRSEVLPQGWQGQKAKPIPCEILVEHDFGIAVRDGAKLYSDIYRPNTNDAKVPAIICWGPFGKKFNGVMSLKLMTPWNLGVPDGALSGLEKFEAPDPADWVPRGYAVINVDSRGCGDSEGTMAIMGTQEAEDGYDVIEAIARMPWCNGRVGLAGNSHLAIIQWFIAALRPPHLTAIAPWEGCGDLYREQFGRGGIYAGALFDKLIVKYMLRGNGGVESFRQMFDKHPLANAWWNDKRPNMKAINVPMYITGTWTNTMHGMGAIRGYLEAATDEKWLRWHGTQEWHDMWANEATKLELMEFFDYYLHQKQNDWPKTPRVRMALLRFGEKNPIENIVVPDFPPPSTAYTNFYLAPNQKLDLGTPSSAQVASYNSESDEFISFTHTFDRKQQLLGMFKAVLHMSCPDHDDMDIYIQLRKLDKQGQPLLNFNIPWSKVPVKSIAEIDDKIRTEVILYAGPCGILRASHREIDYTKSVHPNWPYHPHEREQKIPPGEIVKLDIGIWATGIEFEAGESLRVQIAGHDMSVNNFGTNEHVKNKGTHRVHFGGEYDSHVIVPLVKI